MSTKLLVGDCRVTLATLPDCSVQACITSPPYYGLRDYGTAQWVGGDTECNHRNNNWTRGAPQFGTCSKCGAERVDNQIGLEPTPELWIEHLVDVFRQVRRVLADTGTVWLNLGDSYAGSGKGPSNSMQNDASQIGPSAVKKRNDGQFANGQAPTAWIPVADGYKAKDLMMLPARVALALQADGWYLRSMIPWLKRNSMPESVTDRPASAVEYVFLLSKSAQYFWDADAVRMTASDNSHDGRKIVATHKRAQLMNGGMPISGGGIEHSTLGRPSQQYAKEFGRSLRNADFFFQTWQGLLLDEQDDPLALVVNPAPYKGAHYATFPPKLVEPMITASTSEKGQCPECGAPWVRVTERAANPSKMFNVGDDLSNGAFVGRTANPQTSKGLHRNGGNAEGPPPITTGWRPSCVHTEAEPVPQTILDPFFGSGTVGVVADRLGRNAIGCELSPAYSDQAVDRVTGDAPMFAEIDVA